MIDLTFNSYTLGLVITYIVSLIAMFVWAFYQIKNFPLEGRQETREAYGPITVFVSYEENKRDQAFYCVIAPAILAVLWPVAVPLSIIISGGYFTYRTIEWLLTQLTERRG